MDFYNVRFRKTKYGMEVYPEFLVKKTKDLLIRGGAFQAVWSDELGLWCTDEMYVAEMIDRDLYAKIDELGGDGVVMAMQRYNSSSWTEWKNYVAKLPDSDIDLDTSLNFADDPPDRRRYATKRLPYSLTDGPCPAWDELTSVLYEPREREKIEWSIGSIIAGDSKTNQKFTVFYGPSGKGKSTIISVFEKLFEGYYVPIDMKTLGSASGNFAMSAFKSNPLLAIQHDGDLSKIEDNTRLNSIVSHELMPINEKYKSEYYTRIYAFLVLGTNEPVKITGSKSGIIRRLIDVTPSGQTIENRHYHALIAQIEFELGQIAQHCLRVYQTLGKNYYSNYRPTKMMFETDVFFNFIESNFDYFYTEDAVTLEKAWRMYKEYCDDSKIRHILQRHQFRSELMNYFEQFRERAEVDGERHRSYFSGFKTHRFDKVDTTKPIGLTLDHDTSILDDILAEMPAQYATKSGTPLHRWEDVNTTLADVDTTQVHYVLVPEKHIVIDFDLKDADGKKSRERNLEEAANWPPTYTEYSQGGEGVHLHYIYEGPGQVSDLKASFKDDVEIKTLLGHASLRRRLTKCNNYPIATLTSGLPLKEKPMHDSKAMKSEKAVRRLIIENLRKEHLPGTKPSIDFIKRILDEAYESGIPYDVNDLYPDVFAFAMDSTNHARYCMKVVQEMKFQSESMDDLEPVADKDTLAFYDVEVFPNLLVICWKFAGEDTSVVRMMNPSPTEVDELLKLRLVGFNCRRYDNHILYARAMGMSIEDIYLLSKRIIDNDRSAYFGAAYDLSYTDIYDYSSKKQSLKKFEIELGIHHMELGLPWDEPVPEELWEKVADYCANDVIATEATHEARKADFTARQILAELSGLSVNHSTQQHTARIIFGNDRNPQSKFIYTDLSKMFPGYKYDFGTSTYRGEVVGEGGYVYAEPGYYKDVDIYDVASMHPTSIELLELFGEYTPRFSELLQARLAIKHNDYQSARRMLDGKLAPYLENEESADELSYALKIVINIVYGLTSARFDNAFKDKRNKDNIVAKRGALFMIDLKHYVQEELGLPVLHIKTDSIKVPSPTPEQKQAIMEFGAKYGYTFEHEATYSEFALFNDAVYIAKYGWAAKEKKIGTWEAVGAQFQHPYVFKSVLTGEEIEFDDMCETRNVTKGNIYIETDGERRFVGRIGRFVPLTPGSGGGALLRIAEVDGEERSYAVTGTKGYEWLEAELVLSQGLQDKIDYSYFNNLVDRARADLDALVLGAS